MADGGKDFIEPEKSKARDVEEEEMNMDNNSGDEAADRLDDEVDEEEEENLDNEAANGLQVC